MRNEILVIGSANVDFVMQVERLPRRGETVGNSRFGQQFGGKGANQAVAAARAGAKTLFAGCVGDDVFGGLMKQNLAAAGVNVEHLREAPGVASGAALIMVDSDAENVIAIAPGANRHLSPPMVSELAGAAQRAAIIMLQYEIPTESIYAAIDLAQRCGAQVMLNLAPAGAFARQWLNKLSYLVVNETEAEFLCGFPVDAGVAVEKAADWLLAQGVGTAVITLGAAGSYLASGAERHRVPAFPVAAVDTTAAGDTFCGALAAALVEGQGLRDAARFAAAASAICVTRLGAQSSIPSRAEIEALLARG